LRTVLASDITALVDLAINERQPRLPRTGLLPLFPWIDGRGRTLLLRAAIETTVCFLRQEVKP